ncbi:hypothetical protein WA026_020974 [Henosepilachna vigintioctopunctata]|uniref:Uncharacterized protein n=1 Tax=Henosepilachna vigintioctopunctata TaxID=420089 RepID=A0AAW1VIY8_9CUCU
MHMLHSNSINPKIIWGLLPKNKGNASIKIMEFERCDQGQYAESMMRDYICGLIRESCTEHDKRGKIVYFEKIWTTVLKDEKEDWDSFKAAAQGFLGNQETKNYGELIDDINMNFSIRFECI